MPTVGSGVLTKIVCVLGFSDVSQLLQTSYNLHLAHMVESNLSACA